MNSHQKRVLLNIIKGARPFNTTQAAIFLMNTKWAYNKMTIQKKTSEFVR